MREWLRRMLAAKEARPEGRVRAGGSGQHRQKNLSILSQAGFRVASSLPLVRDEICALRPTVEIAARLQALDTLFGWVVYPEERCSSDVLRRYGRLIDIDTWLTDEERAVFHLDRAQAREQNIGKIGWKVEQVWPLAWVLGFAREPPCDGQIVTNEVTRQLQQFALAIEDSKQSQARSYDEVDALEDLFYCAHNAVRSARLGEDTVPAGFDPISNGGVIWERRRALTWCLSPGVAWDDTDTST